MSTEAFKVSLGFGIGNENKLSFEFEKGKPVFLKIHVFLGHSVIYVCM